MGEPTGLRERKKQRTRRTLIETGLRLFDEAGYEATTVADICAAAELSPATFYKHFPAKEDLVFHEQLERLEAVRDLITDRHPGESLESLLRRCIAMALDPGRWILGPHAAGLIQIRSRLITTVPSLRAITLRWLFDTQHEWAQALERAFPEELDDITAHAIIGALTGAVVSASLANIAKGLDAAPMRDVIERAAQTALASLPSGPR
ncbi:TetR/AcrR family transcriptional regulator [Nonomuraea sp. NPDC046802]|uniref:TetR/AcrR family transcriptional regulator n=1 Tax=Nonomuraea sp. NPDC046802 TaxID=3154919 RepID=UPI0033D948C0